MRIRTLRYYFREAIASLRRNSWLSIASISTVAISLLILGASLLIVLTTSNIAKNIESEVEINVFLDINATDDMVNDIGIAIKKIPEVSQVVFVPKEDGLKELEKSLGEEKKAILKGMLANPLPDTYKVKAKKSEMVGILAEKLKKVQGVKKVRYGQEIVKELFSMIRWIKTIGIGIVLALSFGAIFLISTTIRLTVFARRKEVGIMKFIGATDWFIRWPFLLEGMIIGFTGAVLAVGVLQLAYYSLTASIQENWQFLQLLTGQTILLLFISLLGIGILIGALGSVISLRKFLKV
jgi:cell division transport system permease protein